MIADHQSAGRGRLTRTFETPPQVAVLLSTVLYPIRNSADQGWIPLIIGVAAANAISKYCGLAPVLKWPNDILIGDLKVGGIIAEQFDDCVVVGIGINVLQNSDELPVPTATSLLLECEEDGINAREQLIAYLLHEIRSEFDAWNLAHDNVEILKNIQSCQQLSENRLNWIFKMEIQKKVLPPASQKMVACLFPAAKRLSLLT